MRTATRRAALVAASFTLVLGLAACGDDDDEGGAGGDTPAGEDGGNGGGDGGGGGDDVQLQDFQISPEELTVAPGDTIAIVNGGGVSHTYTSDEAGIDVELGAGERGEATAPSEPGTYDVACRFHSNMQATLTVE